MCVECMLAAQHIYGIRAHSIIESMEYINPMEEIQRNRAADQPQNKVITFHTQISSIKLDKDSYNEWKT